MLGTTVAIITATDPDPNARVTLALTSNPGSYFNIVPSTGALVVARRLSWNDANEIVLRVAANDGLYNVETSVEVTVIDVNDHAPVFNQSAYNVQVCSSEIINFLK